MSTAERDGKKICRSCYLGDCVKCRITQSVYSTGVEGEGVCIGCFLGPCSALTCQALGRRVTSDGEVACNTHYDKGIDYVTNIPWQPHTKFLYVVWWRTECVVKFGVGTSESRHGDWVRGGGELVRLYTLSDEQTDGNILLQLEGWGKKIRRDSGLTQPSVSQLPAALVSKVNKGTECFLTSPTGVTEASESIQTLPTELTRFLESLEATVEENFTEKSVVLVS